MMMKDIPPTIVDAIMGFAGSVIALFIARDVSPREALGIVFAGVSVSYVGTAYVSGLLPPGDGLRGLVGLLLGSIAMPLVARAISFVRSGELPYLGKGGSDRDD